MKFPKLNKERDNEDKLMLCKLLNETAKARRFHLLLYYDSLMFRTCCTSVVLVSVDHYGGCLFPCLDS